MQMVSEVMTRGVQSVSPQESVRRAAQLMEELNVGVLPVCNGDRLVGIVTDRDIVVRATSIGLAPDSASVDDVMSTHVRWCFEDQSLEEVMQQMADTQIRRVPVIARDESHRLVGIVSLGDIASAPADTAQREDIAATVEKVSYPSAPDRSNRGALPDAGTGAGNVTDGPSHTGTAAGLAGSDIVADVMNPGVEVSATADPSDVVDVTPDDLVNRNAAGATSLGAIPERASVLVAKRDGVEVRRVIEHGKDTTSGESGAAGGTDAGGPSDGSGGTAGVAGSAGTGVAAKP